jgi:hypothetical protein
MISLNSYYKTLKWNLPLKSTENSNFSKSEKSGEENGNSSADEAEKKKNEDEDERHPAYIPRKVFL